MRRTSFFVIGTAAALMVGLGGWSASMPHARLTAATGLQIDVIQATANAKTLPAQHYDDYSLVF